MLKLFEYRTLVFLAVILGLAPFYPEPHLFEKLTMLMEGNLKKPVDIFDLFMHGTPIVLLGIKYTYDKLKKPAE